MKTAPIIYTDEDVRPDLLTAEERARFPEDLTNKDRYDILALTRLRIDDKDYNGLPIYSPEEWSKAYDAYLDSDMQEMPSQLQEVIKREVVLPQTGEVKEVDAGLQNVIQKLLDMGIVIDTTSCRSGMVTDHPGMRWMHEDENRTIPYQPGAHMMQFGGETLKPELRFPTGNTYKYYNKDEVLEKLQQAAVASGLIYDVPTVKNEGLQPYVSISMPFLMDGTSHNTFLSEASELAVRQGMPENYTERVNHYLKAKEEVAKMHGGIAMFSDTMIQDRFARFERQVQRSIGYDNSLLRMETSKWCYEDFLTGEQNESLHLDSLNKRNELWEMRGLPHVYSNYNESRERVDEVARMAGYHDYLEYAGRKVPASEKKDKQCWTEFQRLKEKHLTVNNQGRNKIFRISNGVGRQVKDYLTSLYRRQAMPVIDHYRQCGYPVDRVSNITVLYDNENNTARMIAMIDGKYETKAVEPDVFARLKLNASTPFETALATFADELQWKGKLNINVSDETARRIDLYEKDGSGIIPLTTDGQVYKVDESTWQHAKLLTRFERMSPWLQHKVLQRVPPVNDAGRLSYTDLQTRMDAVIDHIDRTITGLKVVDVKRNDLVLQCKVDGLQHKFVMPSVRFNDRTALLPDESAGQHGKLAVAEHLGERLFEGEQVSSGRKR